MAELGGELATPTHITPKQIGKAGNHSGVKVFMKFIYIAIN